MMIDAFVLISLCAVFILVPHSRITHKSHTFEHNFDLIWFDLIFMYAYHFRNDEKQNKVSGSNSIQNTSHLHNTQQHQASNPQAIAGNYTNNPYSRYTGFLTYNTNNTIPHNTNNTNTPHQMQHPTLRLVSRWAHTFIHVFKIALD